MFGKSKHTHAPYSYAQQLISRGHGYPLWFPDGGDSPHIGDVGYVDEGRFRRVFNIMSSGKDEFSPHGVPPNHVPVLLPKLCASESIPNYLPPGECVVAHTVTLAAVTTKAGGQSHQIGVEAEYKFDYTGSACAIAIVGESGATQSRITQKGRFREAMGKNYEDWYAFARSLDFELRKKDIILVYGWVKSPHWAIATSTSRVKKQSMSISATIGPVAPLQLSFQGSKSAAPSYERRYSDKFGSKLITQLDTRKEELELADAVNALSLASTSDQSLGEDSQAASSADTVMSENTPVASPVDEKEARPSRMASSPKDVPPPQPITTEPSQASTARDAEPQCLFVQYFKVEHDSLFRLKLRSEAAAKDAQKPPEWSALWRLRRPKHRNANKW